MSRQPDTPSHLAAVLIFILALKHGAAAATRAELSRSAALLKGQVLTTRALPPPLGGTHSRLLSSADTQQLWLLGLHPDHQEVVRQLLAGGSQAGGGAQVLHSLPGGTQDSHHWLVRASREAVLQLLGTHEHVTAAVLPSTMKVSPTIDEVVGACRGASTYCAARLLDSLQLSQAKHTRVTLLASADGVADILMPELARSAQARLQLLLETHHRASVELAECQATVKAGKRQLMIQALCLQDLGAVASLFASTSEITWLELQPRAMWHDLYSVANQQVSPTSWMPGGSWPVPDVTLSQLRPFWAAGIDGTGQVAGMLDSGLDMDSCFVYDPAQNDYQSVAAASNRSIYVNPSARKVAMYAMIIDGVDSLESHGTHVATSIVGAAYGTNPITHPDMATGVAPGAQVAVADLEFTYPNGTGGGGINISSLDNLGEIFDILSEGGAHISCNSWGINLAYKYTHVVCQDLDEYAWEHPYMLQVFAAGNDGSNLSMLTTTGTVSAPGTCKNVLTVGAAANYVLQGMLTINQTINLRNDSGAQVQLWPSNFSSPIQHGLMRVTFANKTVYRLNPLPLQGFDSRSSNLGSSTCLVVLAKPRDACTALTSATFSVPSRRRLQQSRSCFYLVVERTSACSLATAIGHITADSRARGAYFYYASQDQVDSASANKTLITVNNLNLNGFAAGLTRNATLAATLVKHLQTSRVAATVTFSPPNASEPAPAESVANFSSYGSGRAFGADETRSLFYRIKPDVIAPGYILAGRSDARFTGQQDQCATCTMDGTSMATPQVTGAVILARQYFVDGFYPTGAKVAENAFTPTAALLKAIIIAGAQAMGGFSVAEKKPLAPPPSPFQGFGKVALWASLPLATDSNRPGLQVVNQVHLVQGSTHNYSINVVSNGHPLSVVLAFQDWPSFPGAATSYVNNLDLQVAAPDGTVLYPNGRSSPDPTNNVEKIHVALPMAGTYNIQIQGTYVYSLAQAQPYALVVLGALAPDAQLHNTTTDARGSGPPPTPPSGGFGAPPSPPSPGGGVPQPSALLAQLACALASVLLALCM